MSLAFAILAFLSGSMVGSVIAQAITGHREKQARRADFRGFLGGWLGRSKMVADVAALHAENLPHLWGYYGKVYRDFSAKERKRLKAICENLTATTKEECRNYPERFEGKIEALIDFV
jgi:hypothetical protein